MLLECTLALCLCTSIGIRQNRRDGKVSLLSSSVPPSCLYSSLRSTGLRCGLLRFLNSKKLSFLLKSWVFFKKAEFSKKKLSFFSKKSWVFFQKKCWVFFSKKSRVFFFLKKVEIFLKKLIFFQKKVEFFFQTKKLSFFLKKLIFLKKKKRFPCPLWATVF